MVLHSYSSFIVFSFVGATGIQSARLFAWLEEVVEASETTGHRSVDSAATKIAGTWMVLHSLAVAVIASAWQFV